MTVPVFGMVDLNGNRISNSGDAVSPNDLATLNQVLQLRNQVDQKDACRVATTGSNITLSGLQTIDGVTVVAGDRVLVKDQTDSKTNGVYVAASGAWARATDADASAEVTFGLSVAVVSGTTKGTGFTIPAAVNWILATADPIVVGTTALTFQVQGGTGSAYSFDDGINATGSSVNLDLMPSGGLRFVNGRVGVIDSLLQIAPDPFAAWRVAVQNRNATWVAVGSGFTEGQGSTSLANRWVQRLRDTIRASRGMLTGRGGVFIPPRYNVSGVSPWAATATSTTGTVAYADTTASAPGRRGAKLTTPAQMNFTVTGTSIDIWHTRGPGVGTYQYNIDDTTNVPVNMNQTGTEVLVKTRVSLGSYGTHTVKIIMSSGIMFFGGLTVWDGDESAGVRVIDSAITGETPTNILASIDAVVSMAPDLVTLEVGNNFTDANATITLITNFVNTLKQQVGKSVSVGLILPDLTAMGATGTSFATALRALVASDKTLGLLDLSSIGYAKQADNFSPNDAGQSTITSNLATLLGVPVVNLDPVPTTQFIMVGGVLAGLKEIDSTGGVFDAVTCTWANDRLATVTMTNPARTYTFLYDANGIVTGMVVS